MKQRLLVLDDEKPFADYVHRIAERQGYESHTATCAQKFKELFEKFNPAVVVLDIVMPDVDGIEMALWLKSRDYRGRVLFVTGYNPHFATWAKQLNEFGNFADVESMTKPISAEELMSFLQWQAKAV